MTFRDTLPTGKALNQDDQVVSNSGRYQLILQKDGNLVLYDLSGGQKALWASGTTGQAANQCIMQTDGNLVLYDLFGGQKALWASGTAGHPNSFLRVQDDRTILNASKLIMLPEHVTEEHLDPCLVPAGLPR